MTMNDDIQKYPIYGLTTNGLFVKLDFITSTNSYNHSTHQVHHYIPKRKYRTYKKWYDAHGIEQKLFLIPITLHEQIHFQAVKNLTDEEFARTYHISRWDLIFDRKHSNY